MSWWRDGRHTLDLERRGFSAAQPVGSMPRDPEA